MARYVKVEDAIEVADYGCGEFRGIFGLIKERLEAMPAADVRENVHANWIKMSDADGVYWACSECGEDIPRVSDFDPQFDLFPRLKSIEKTRFCPFCGAKMEEALWNSLQ